MSVIIIIHVSFLLSVLPGKKIMLKRVSIFNICVNTLMPNLWIQRLRHKETLWISTRMCVWVLLMSVPKHFLPPSLCFVAPTSVRCFVALRSIPFTFPPLLLLGISLNCISEAAYSGNGQCYHGVPVSFLLSCTGTPAPCITCWQQADVAAFAPFHGPPSSHHLCVLLKARHLAELQDTSWFCLQVRKDHV